MKYQKIREKAKKKLRIEIWKRRRKLLKLLLIKIIIKKEKILASKYFVICLQ